MRENCSIDGYKQLISTHDHLVLDCSTSTCPISVRFNIRCVRESGQSMEIRTASVLSQKLQPIVCCSYIGYLCKEFHDSVVETVSKGGLSMTALAVPVLESVLSGQIS